MNAPWPAANEMAAGAMPANSTAIGSSTQSRVVSVPMISSTTAPITKPMLVPRIPRAMN